MLMTYVDLALRTLISDSGLTQIQAAELIGVPVDTLRGWVRPGRPRAVDLDQLIPPTLRRPDAERWCCRVTRVLIPLARPATDRERADDRLWDSCGGLRVSLGVLPHHIAPDRPYRDVGAIPGWVRPADWPAYAESCGRLALLYGPHRGEDCSSVDGEAAIRLSALRGWGLGGSLRQAAAVESALEDDPDVQVDVLDELIADGVDDIPF